MLIIDRNTGAASCDYTQEQKEELWRAMIRSVGNKALQAVQLDPAPRAARREAKQA